MMKVSITSSGSKWQYVLPDAMHYKKTHHSCGIPAKVTQSESNHDDLSDKPKLRDIPQNKWSVLFKIIYILKYKQLQMKET